MKSNMRTVVLICCLVGLTACVNPSSATPSKAPPTETRGGFHLTEIRTASPTPKPTSAPISTKTATSTPTTSPMVKMNGGLLAGLGWELTADNNGISIIDLDSGNSTRLTGPSVSLNPPTWSYSPTGDRILYPEFNLDTNRVEKYTVLNRESGEKITLTGFPETIVPISSWHPGGIFFAIANNLFDASTGQRLEQIGGDVFVFRNSFSRDGKQISMVIPEKWMMLLSNLVINASGQTTGATERVRLCGFSDGGLTCLDRSIDSITQEDYDLINSSQPLPIYDAKWSPREDILAILSGNDIYLLNPDGSIVRNLTRGFLDQRGYTQMEWTIDWSPDGKMILFGGYPGWGSQPQIFVTKTDGSGVVEITGDPYPFGNLPAWSPDSQWVIYSGSSETGQGMVLAKADGSQRTLISTDFWGVGFNLRYKTRVASCPGSLPSGLAVGRPGSVSFDPPVANRVRREPSKSAAVMGQMIPGEEFIVLEGPVCADGWTWWRVRSNSQQLEGWSSDGDGKEIWLRPIAIPSLSDQD
jgi:hypothetical protein